jgi:hypothetical protein
VAIDFIEEEDKLKSRTISITLMPEAWQNFKLNEAAYPCSWKVIKLDEVCKNDPDLSKTSGIYTLLIMPGIAQHPSCSYLMYVGQTHNLYLRFRNYLSREKTHRVRPNVFRLLNIYSDRIWFCFTKVAGYQLDRYENALMNAYIPPVNNVDRLPAEIRSIKGAF